VRGKKKKVRKNAGRNHLIKRHEMPPLQFIFLPFHFLFSAGHSFLYIIDN
jgi:hypothetical protein